MSDFENPFAPQQKKRLMAEINVVPYIDVMLVLLVIFMTTAPLMVEGVRVDLPDANAEPVSSDDLEDPLIVSMRSASELYVNLGQGDGDGNRISADALSEQVRKIVSARPDVPLFLRADTSIPYGEVMALMAQLQQSGVRSVGLITEPPAPP